jgi:hypothetical protein
MSWFDGSEDERLKNLILYKMYATDKEMEEMAPMLLGILAIIVVVGAFFYFF